MPGNASEAEMLRLGSTADSGASDLWQKQPIGISLSAQAGPAQHRGGREGRRAWLRVVLGGMLEQARVGRESGELTGTIREGRRLGSQLGCRTCCTDTARHGFFSARAAAARVQVIPLGK